MVVAGNVNALAAQLGLGRLHLGRGGRAIVPVLGMLLQVEPINQIGVRRLRQARHDVPLGAFDVHLQHHPVSRSAGLHHCADDVLGLHIHCSLPALDNVGVLVVHAAPPIVVLVVLGVKEKLGLGLAHVCGRGGEHVHLARELLLDRLQLGRKSWVGLDQVGFPCTTRRAIGYRAILVRDKIIESVAVSGTQINEDALRGPRLRRLPHRAGGLARADLTRSASCGVLRHRRHWSVHLHRSSQLCRAGSCHQGASETGHGGAWVEFPTTGAGCGVLSGLDREPDNLRREATDATA
mmetsp:Transcript_28896/g.69922  ORF Transcript_28896/g.69922 Transcript_28896/m.69922 type:complete len:294 (+) Transcript_28896:192-1073(+)